MGVIDPHGMGSFDPRGLIGRIYVGKRYMLLYTKYIWFQRRFFLCFSHNKSMGAIYPQSVASFDPRDLIGRIYVGDHKTLHNI